MAQLGAAVLKIEPPGEDPLEAFCPEWYRQLSEGQEVVRHDLKSDDERAFLRDALGEAELLVTSMRPAALDRLSLSSTALREDFPLLSHLAIYGHSVNAASVKLCAPSHAPAEWATGMSGVAHALAAQGSCRHRRRQGHERALQFEGLRPETMISAPRDGYPTGSKGWVDAARSSGPGTNPLRFGTPESVLTIRLRSSLRALRYRGLALVPESARDDRCLSRFAMEVEPPPGESTSMIIERHSRCGMRALSSTALTLLLLLGGAACASAQQQSEAVAHDDGASVDHVIAALYEAISGPAGQPRDWDRLRPLFVPEARMIPTGRQPDGTGNHTVWTVDEYIERNSDLMVEIGFRESEIGRVTERFGAIAHVYSAYEAHRDGETEPMMRGVNSFQLWNDGARWWIVSLMWQQESPDHPIPERFLDSLGQSPE